MKTYKILVRVPIGPGSNSTRVVEVRIQAMDAHAARGMAMSQYGSENLVSLPIEVR